MALLQRISHTGAAVPSALAAQIAPADLTFTLTQTSGWPTGAGSRPFVIVVDPNTTIEEKILCATQTSGTVTVASGGRGFDNTVPTGHAAGAVVEHCAAALELDDDNDHIYTVGRDDHTQYAPVTGARPFTGPVSMQSGLTVVGPTALTGTLTETGNATVSGTLGVGGTTTLAGLAVNGNETVAGTLAVSGATTVAGLTVTGTVAGNLAVAGNLTAATVDAGLVGATAAGRLVGATAAGPPTTGTFVVGDFVVDQKGVVWTCVAAGSPGTWLPNPGTMVAHGTGPPGLTNFVAHSPAFTVNVSVFAGAVYKIEGRILGTQQTAAGNVVLADLQTSDGLVNARFLSTYIPVGTEEAGGGATIWSPTSTAARTVTLNVQANGGAFQVGANAAEMIVTRVA
jgi:hypothetical protein